MTDVDPRLQQYLERPLPDLMAELSLYDDPARGMDKT